MSTKQYNEVQHALLTARMVISTKDTWCQNAEAMDSSGIDSFISGDHPTAVKWCASGAVQLAVPKKLQIRTMRALNEAAVELFPSVTYGGTKTPTLDAIEINDCKKHSDILKVFDHAIMCSGN